MITAYSFITGATDSTVLDSSDSKVSQVTDSSDSRPSQALDSTMASVSPNAFSSSALPFSVFLLDFLGLLNLLVFPLLATAFASNSLCLFLSLNNNSLFHRRQHELSVQLAIAKDQGSQEGKQKMATQKMKRHWVIPKPS